MRSALRRRAARAQLHAMPSTKLSTAQQMWIAEKREVPETMRA